MLDVHFVSGQKRSGNHLIINWILSHYNNSIFINDINPFDYKNISYIEDTIKNIKIEDKTDCILISCETPHLLIHDDIITIINNYINYSDLYTPFIMRDPINCFFSCIILIIKNRNLTENKSNIISAIKDSKQNIWEKMLNNIPLWEKSSFPINYNIFVKNIEYRKNISNKIKKEFKIEIDSKIMNTLWKIPAVSFASSFDSNQIKDNASSMNVLKRYKKYLYLLDEIEMPEQIKEFIQKTFPEIKLNYTIKIW